MAGYEQYLIVILFAGLIIIFSLVCIWMILSSGKPRKEDGGIPVSPEIGKLTEDTQTEEPEPIPEKTTPALEVAKPDESALPWKPEILEGSRGAVLQAYYRAMKIVEGLTQVSMNPQMTLRGFLKETTPLISGAGDAFAELTVIAERILYSPHTPAEDDVLRAETLSLKVEEAITNDRS